MGGDQTSKFEEPQFEDAQSSYQSPSEIDYEKADAEQFSMVKEIY